MKKCGLLMILDVKHGVSLWTSKQTDFQALEKSEKKKPESECTAAFTGRNRWTFGFHMSAPAADIKSLKTSERILVHWIGKSLCMSRRKHRVLVIWHVGCKCMKLLHLYVLGFIWASLRLIGKERCLVVGKMLHSQIECLWRGRYFSSCNSESVYFLPQCFIKCCIVSRAKNKLDNFFVLWSIFLSCKNRSGLEI